MAASWEGYKLLSTLGLAGYGAVLIGQDQRITLATLLGDSFILHTVTHKRQNKDAGLYVKMPPKRAILSFAQD